MKDLILCVSILLMCTVSPLRAAELTPWELYLESPTPANAAKVTVLKYSGPQPDFTPEGDLQLLAVQVQSVDREAIRLAFRLLRDSDGGQAETLCIMLGRVIRVNPGTFLKELSAAHVAPGGVGWIVGNLGPEYVDRTQARRYEAQQRIGALRTVKDSRLQQLREACVKELQASQGDDGG